MRRLLVALLLASACSPSSAEIEHALDGLEASYRADCVPAMRFDRAYTEDFRDTVIFRIEPIHPLLRASCARMATILKEHGR